MAIKTSDLHTFDLLALTSLRRSDDLKASLSNHEGSTSSRRSEIVVDYEIKVGKASSRTESMKAAVPWKELALALAAKVNGPTRDVVMHDVMSGNSYETDPVLEQRAVDFAKQVASLAEPKIIKVAPRVTVGGVIHYAGD